MLEQAEAQSGRRPIDGSPEYSVAVVTGLVGSVATARARLALLSPGVTTEAMPLADPPCVAVLISSDWSAAPLLSAVAASLGAVVISLGRRVTADKADQAQRELVEAAAVAVRMCTPNSVIGLDELRTYRSLISMPRPELESLVRETLGGILQCPKPERERLIRTLWARHRHDTDSGAVRALRIDPRTMRRRRDRIHELTGLDPVRQRDRLRLDLGLHALRVVARDPITRGHTEPAVSPYPTESQNPGKRPTFGIASHSRSTSPFAPQSPRPALGAADREERTT